MSMAFIEFCRDCGIVIDTLPPYGVWRRYPTVDHPRKRNGAVKWMETHGFVQNHALMTEPRLWRPEKLVRPLTQNEIRRAREQAAIRQRNEQSARREAIQSMREYWAGLPLLRGNHPYLERKGLSIRGCEHLKRDGDLLVIPMFRAGELMSVQTIDQKGRKKFRFNCPIKGASYRLQRRAGTITCLCEGFATGLTIFQSIPTANVAVCFNSSGLVDVAKSGKFTGMAVICADNDHKTAGNPGLVKGREAAEILKCGIAYPDGISGTDWDDARQEWGEKAESKIRMEVLRQAKMIR